MNLKLKITNLLEHERDWLIDQIAIYIDKGNSIDRCIRFPISDTIMCISDIVVCQIGNNIRSTNFGNSGSGVQPKIGKLTAHLAVFCHRESIEAHNCLEVLKHLRKLYFDILKKYRYTMKKALFDLFGKIFDDIDVAFVQEFYVSGSKSLTNKLSTTLRDLTNSVDHPVIITNCNYQLICCNQSTNDHFPSVLNRGETIIPQIPFIERKDILPVLKNFSVSDQHFKQVETNIECGEETSMYLMEIIKLTGYEILIFSFININKWKLTLEKLENDKQTAINENNNKTTFLANMSHEIRTPMNAIVGFAELMSLTNPSPETKAEYYNMIKRCSSDLLNLIDDILDFSKLEGNKIKIKPKQTCPAKIINDLKKIYDKELELRSNNYVKIVITTPLSDMDLCIKTDPKRLKQVLVNLIGNAVKFTQQGYIEVGYKLTKNNLVQFFVKDTGIGIPTDKQPTIFNSYAQVEDHYELNPNGSGLGLAICKNIVQLLGGKIWFNSAVNTGSNFFFSIPNIPVSAMPASIQPRKSNFKTELNLQNRSILIAEDNDSNFVYLKELLKSTGASITRAADGLEAIGLSNRNDFDLVLMDIRMPEINGVEASKHILKAKPQLPILAITAFAMDEDRQICSEAGCLDYLAKPIHRDVLYKKISKILLGTEESKAGQTKKERV